MEYDLNPELRQDISNRINATNELTGDYAKDKSFKEFQPQEYNLGSQFEKDAIYNKAKERFYDPAIENIRAQQKANYANIIQQKMKTAQEFGVGQLRYDQARALAAADRRAQEESQRAQMISSLFQTGGAIAGMAFGGAGGGMVGSQIGSSAGSVASRGGK